MSERKYMLIAFVVLLIIAVVYYAITWEPEKEESKEDVAPTSIPEVTQNIIDESEIHDVEKELPIMITKSGWRPISKTMPTEGYIWEWAVEVTNLTPVTVTVQITYHLEDDAGIVLAKSVGGGNLLPYEKKTVIGRAVSPKIIENTKKQKVWLSVTPTRGNEDVEKVWKWKRPYSFVFSSEKQVFISDR